MSICGLLCVGMKMAYAKKTEGKFSVFSDSRGNIPLVPYRDVNFISIVCKYLQRTLE